MNDEKLIECVRKNIVLYDMSNPKYMDLSAKNEIWEKIGAEMNVDGGSCKVRWNNIRDTYRKSMKRTAAKIGQAAKKIKLYKYSNQLSFLQKYLDERETLSSIKIEDQTSDTQKEQLEDTTGTTTDDDVQTEEILGNGSNKEQVPTPTTQTNKKSTFRLPPKPCVSAKANTNTDEGSASSILMEILIKDKLKSQPAEHSVDVFLNAMAPSLKTLSPYNWHLAKSEIFSVVQKYELKTLMGQGQPQPYDIPGSAINLQHSATPSLLIVQSHSNDSATGTTGESNIQKN